MDPAVSRGVIRAVGGESDGDDMPARGLPQPRDEIVGVLGRCTVDHDTGPAPLMRKRAAAIVVKGAGHTPECTYVHP